MNLKIILLLVALQFVTFALTTPTPKFECVEVVAPISLPTGLTQPGISEFEAIMSPNAKRVVVSSYDNAGQNTKSSIFDLESSPHAFSAVGSYISIYNDNPFDSYRVDGSSIIKRETDVTVLTLASPPEKFSFTGNDNNFIYTRFDSDSNTVKLFVGNDNSNIMNSVMCNNVYKTTSTITLCVSTGREYLRDINLITFGANSYKDPLLNDYPIIPHEFYDVDVTNNPYYTGQGVENIIAYSYKVTDQGSSFKDKYFVGLITDQNLVRRVPFTSTSPILTEIEMTVTDVNVEYPHRQKVTSQHILYVTFTGGSNEAMSDLIVYNKKGGIIFSAFQQSEYTSYREFSFSANHEEVFSGSFKFVDDRYKGGIIFGENGQKKFKVIDCGISGNNMHVHILFLFFHHVYNRHHHHPFLNLHLATYICIVMSILTFSYDVCN
jgi:hypothetical protein